MEKHAESPRLDTSPRASYARIVYCERYLSNISKHFHFNCTTPPILLVGLMSHSVLSLPLVRPHYTASARPGATQLASAGNSILPAPTSMYRISSVQHLFVLYTFLSSLWIFLDPLMLFTKQKTIPRPISLLNFVAFVFVSLLIAVTPYASRSVSTGCVAGACCAQCKHATRTFRQCKRCRHGFRFSSLLTLCGCALCPHLKYGIQLD